MMKNADESLAQMFVRIISSYSAGAAQFTQNELNLTAYMARLLQIMDERRIYVYNASASFPAIPIGCVQSLLVSLNERQRRGTGIVEDKVAKKAGNLREKNAAFHRASNALVSLVQASTILECSDAIISRPHFSTQLYEVLTHLVNHFQLYRVEIMKEDTILDDNSSFKSGSSSDIIKDSKAPKENNKKRCQDLINKPMEFCRNIEGFVVQVRTS